MVASWRVTLVGGVLLLAACGSSATPPAQPAATTTTASPSASATASASPSPSAKPAVTQLKTTPTSLGPVVTDGAGTTLYMYTRDSQGTSASACTGACLVAWPLVVSETTPALTGVTGQVALIPTTDGRRQVTLNGWPLYYYAKDTKPGDVTGQNVNGVWFVLDTNGAPVKGSP